MSRRAQHALLLPLVALAAAAMCWYSVVAGRHFVDSAHNGFFLKNAIDVREGRVLFRDSFNSYGLLSTLVHVVGLEIWGRRITSLLYVTLAFVVALGLGVYAVWCWVMPPWAAALVAALFFLFNYRIHLPWPNYIATCAIVPVAFALRASLRSGRRALWIAVAGAGVGVVFLARQTVAVPLLGVGGLFVAAVAPERSSARGAPRAPQDVALFFCGFGAALAPFFIYLIATSALHDWWIQSVRLIPLWYSPFAQVGDTFGARLAYGRHLLFDDVPVITTVALVSSVALLARRIATRREKADADLALLAAISAGMLAQMYPNEGLWRHVLALSVAFGWPIYWLYRIGRSVGGATTVVLVGAGFLALAVPKILAVRDEVRAAIEIEAHRELYFDYMTEPEPFRGMWLPKAQAAMYRRIDAAIQAERVQRPDVQVIVANGDVLPLTFIRHNTGFNPMFTVYPSLAWARIVRGPIDRATDAERDAALAEGRYRNRFVSDTPNVLGYPDYWRDYASFLVAHRPLVVNSGEPVAGYETAADVVFDGPASLLDSQYYFWWTQFAATPRSVVWIPRR